MLSHIPQDIVTHVIDELSHDIATLKNCTLVSQSFFGPSRIGLFSYICIDVHIPGQFRRFNNIAQSAQISLLVREVRLEYDNTRGYPDGNGPEEIIDTMLQMLPRTCAFTLWGHSKQRELPDKLRSSLIQVFSSPNIASITLHSLPVPIWEVIQSHVKHLYLSNALTGDNMRSIGPLVPKHSLVSLSVVGSNAALLGRFHDSLSHSQSSLVVSNLRKFTVTPMSKMELNDAWSIMLAAAHSLEHFETCSDSFRRIGMGMKTPLFTLEPLNIGMLTNLHSLKLMFTEISLKRHNCDWLPNFLGTVSHANRIKFVELVMPSSVPKSDIDGHWAKLDSVLMLPEYGDLVRVTVSPYDDELSHESWMRFIESQLPLLHAKGLLHIDPALSQF